MPSFKLEVAIFEVDELSHWALIVRSDPPTTLELVADDNPESNKSLRFSHSSTSVYANGHNPKELLSVCLMKTAQLSEVILAAASHDIPSEADCIESYWNGQSWVMEVLEGLNGRGLIKTRDYDKIVRRLNRRLQTRAFVSGVDRVANEGEQRKRTWKPSRKPIRTRKALRDSNGEHVSKGSQ
jgi:hypothetical protein